MIKPVKWKGSSRNQTPKLVPRNIGQALYPAQRGEEYPSVKAQKDCEFPASVRDRVIFEA